MSAGRPDVAQLLTFDRRCCADQVIGCDEAGRGCLAGPIVAAAVRLQLTALTGEQIAALTGLGDSKALTARARERLYPHIIAVASAVSIVARSASAIDRHGIQWANLDAMSTAVQRVWTAGAAVLIDGFGLPDAPFEHERVVKGDAQSASIAAASVVAKVSRDRMMAAAALRWPAYGFDRHAGYPTPAHKQALRDHGPTRMHRASFANR